jgi:PTH2 family peptidyl-tRNA hydrolase
MNNLSEYAMYIFINNDLKMDKGKIASQTGHIVQQIIENIKDVTVKKDFIDRYNVWKNNGSTKIILKASEKQLKELLKLPESVYIIDAGRTQIPSNSLTAVGFYPNIKKNMIDITKDYKLL